MSRSLTGKLLGEWQANYKYFVGDLVTNSLKIYSCNTEHTSLLTFSSDLSSWDSINEVEWSSSEKLWPFEKDILGRTLYVKEVSLGALPNNGAIAIAHGISYLSDTTKLFKFDLFIYGNGRIYRVPTVYSPVVTETYVINTQVILNTTWDASLYTGKARLYYSH